MSAINVITFENVLIFPHTALKRACRVEETRIIPLVAPVVSRKWAVEVTSDGTRHLVAHWFKNEKAH